MALGDTDHTLQPGMLPVDEPLGTAAQDGADSVKRVVLAATMAVGLLLHPSADLVDRGGAEIDDMERIEHGGRVLELAIDGVLVAVERI